MVWRRPNRASCTVTFSEQNLPAGLASGNPLVPGSAIPRTGASFYSGVGYTATDPLGSTFTGTFDLHVFGYQVQSQGNYGNEVNPFGNGLDAYQQHEYPGPIIAGVDRDPDRPGDPLHPQQRHAFGCVPVRVRPRRVGIRALRVRPRRRLGF
jgi:hypothetical protein